MIIRPMKAGPFVPAHVRYPAFVQPKYDGWRLLGHEGVAYTSRLKPFRNQHIQSVWRQFAESLEGLDGEIAVGDHLAPDCYSVTESGVSSFAGEPDFTYFVFDTWTDRPAQFHERYRHAQDAVALFCSPRVQLVPNRLVESEEELLAVEEEWLVLGYEGVIVRDPCGEYKQGRSTSREGACIKVKRFVDSEAVIVGFEELLSNQNEAQTNELGLTKRSGHRANMVPMNTLGALLARDINPESEFFGVEFRVGVFKGLTKEQLKYIWDHQAEFLGRPFVYKYQRVGGYLKPRIPVWKGWRSELLL